MASTSMRTRLPARDESLVQLGVRSDKWDFLVALAGNPNTGKSTVFNALTGSGALAANYPFATVDPNTGIALVPDPRIGVLTDLFKSKKTTYSTLEVRDIAGLVEGASKGEGLGNQFLGHIREVDALLALVKPLL